MTGGYSINAFYTPKLADIVPGVTLYVPLVLRRPRLEDYIPIKIRTLEDVEWAMESLMTVSTNGEVREYSVPRAIKFKRPQINSITYGH